MPALTLSLLGPLHITRDGTPLTHWPSAKARALLLYLVLEPRAHSRDALATLLWPRNPPHLARKSLTQALRVLRDVIGDRAADLPFLLTTTTTIQWNPAQAVPCDASTVLTLLAPCPAHPATVDLCPACQPRLADACVRYTGPLLPTLTLPDSPAFEAWVLERQATLQQRVVQALDRLSAHALQHRQYAPAIAWVTQLLTLDPFHDPAHGRLLRLLAATQQRTAALAHYGQYQATLQRELGLPPDPAVAAIADQIRAGTLGPSPQPAPLAVPATLPTPTTPCLGREAECAAISVLLQDPACRLVTVLGLGGIGKTRLAIAVAHTLAPAFPDGVLFLPLATCTDGAAVLAMLAQLLEVAAPTPAALLAQVVRTLQPRRMLLVWDNVEHLPAARGLLTTLIEGAPRVVVLATSRTVLHVAGEHCLPIPPLSLASPDPAAGARPPAGPAVQLFAARAQAVDPQFRLTAATQPLVQAICERLDGIPLAIELAAARSAVFRPAALLRRLDPRLPLLTGGGAHREPRQQTMRHALDWSYDLLTTEQQQLFAALAVCAGGTRSDAVAALVPQVDPGQCDTVLLQLTQHSLVATRDDPDGEPRFLLLEVVREYAAEQLRASGQLAAVQRAHAAWYRALVEQAQPARGTPQQQAWLDRLEGDLANLDAALSWGLAQAEVDWAAALGIALGWIWAALGRLTSGRQWLTRLLEHPASHSAPWRLDVLNTAGILAWRQGAYETAAPLFAESLKRARQVGDVLGEVVALGNLANIASVRQDYATAATYLQAVLRAAHGHDLQQIEAVALSNLATQAVDQHDLSQAHAYATQSLRAYQALNHVRGMSIVQCTLGTIARLQQDYAAAATWHQESIAAAERSGDRIILAQAEYGLGWVYLEQGRHAQAQAVLSRCVTFAATTEQHQGVVDGLMTVGCLAAVAGEPLRALQLWGCAAQLGAVHGLTANPQHTAVYAAHMEQVRAGLPADTVAVAWAQGATMALADAIALATAPGEATARQATVPMGRTPGLPTYGDTGRS